MITVTLDEGTQYTAQRLAQLRYQSNREAGVDNGRIGPQSDWQTDLDGIGAELAFCQLTNLWPDLSIKPRKGGADCRSHRGKTIDVKTTRHSGGRLLATTDKQLEDADIYVLMVGSFPTYTWIGWATAEELLNRKNITDLGYGPTYALEQSALHAPVGD